MKPTLYREAIARLGLTQTAAAALFDASERTGRNWASKGPPLAVALCLWMLIKRKISVGDIERWKR